jgi:prepilin-type N-terminal cleavage/methylation domain-containing protein
MLRLTSRAFSLVELLVVIAIISVLVSLIVPSLKSAREVAMLAKCSSGTRQLSIAHKMYMGDWKESMIATGRAAWGDSWYNRLVITSYTNQNLFNRGGCPYAPATYNLTDNDNVFYGHSAITAQTSYGLFQNLTGIVDYATKAWVVADWNGASYYAKNITSAKQHRYKRFQKWPSDVGVFHCSTTPNSTNYGLAGINVRYTLGSAYGNWVVDPALTTFARHARIALPMAFSDLHGEAIKIETWTLDTKREIRWKTMPYYNKPEYMNSGAYANPDL